MCSIRKQRGLEIAAVSKIARKSDGSWSVPSQSGKDRYSVRLGAGASECHCNCPDHEMRGERCKHMFAVEFVMEREFNEDGSTTVTETMRVTETKRTTYPQNWPAYNAAQTNEKSEFQRLLYELTKGIENTPQQGRGQRRLAMADAVFAVTFKIFSTVSGRRFISDLCEAQKKGYIDKVPHFNSIFNYLDNPEMTPVLLDLIHRCSLPLTAVESDFAADSTGFTSSRFVKWYDHKYGAVRQHHDWCKAHMICGVKTNIVTAVEIYDRDASDTKILPSMLQTTADNGFTMREVSADKGYSSISNTNAIASFGATPYIAFKARHNGKGGGLWEKMFHYFSFQREDFLAHYHKRSNVESTAMMIKTKFGDGVRSRTEIAMKNEVLCKVLCHNICCLISAMFELGIQPIFAAPN